MHNQNHHKKKNLLTKAFQYGFHLWIVLFVSNLLIFYTYSMITRAAEESPVDSISPALTETISQLPSKVPPTLLPPPKPTKVVAVKPKGPVINLSFTLPGIGSGGGIMNPERKSRNLTIFLYATDVNSYDSKIKPLNTIRTRIDYDDNELSPTYTTFINEHIDLGEDVKKGKYQIAFVTDQSIIQLVREKPDDIGGKIVDLGRTDTTILPVQRMIMGDVEPATGDNILDIADWNTFVACYAKTTPCEAFKRVDFNDDGIVDGIDYNILARSYNEYYKLGFPVTVLSGPPPTPVSKLSQLKLTPKVSKAVSPSPAAQTVKKGGGGNPLGALGGFFFFLIVVSGIGFGLSKTKFGKAFLATHPIPFLIPKTPKTDTKTATPQEGDTPASETPEAQPQEQQPSAEGETPATNTSVEAVAESTEIPIEALKAEKSAGTTAPDTATASDPNSVDKTYYVKNKSKDDKGAWVILTDDAGPVDGLFPSGTIEDGFERIKGKMVEESGKKYILISEVLPSE